MPPKLALGHQNFLYLPNFCLKNGMTDIFLTFVSPTNSLPQAVVSQCDFSTISRFLSGHSQCLWTDLRSAVPPSYWSTGHRLPLYSRTYKLEKKNFKTFYQTKKTVGPSECSNIHTIFILINTPYQVNSHLLFRLSENGGKTPPKLALGHHNFLYLPIFCLKNGMTVFLFEISLTSVFTTSCPLYHGSRHYHQYQNCGLLHFLKC